MTCKTCYYAEFLNPNPKQNPVFPCDVKCLAKGGCYFSNNECKNGEYKEQTNEQRVRRALPKFHHGTDRQKWSANKIRDEYVTKHLDRFLYLIDSGVKPYDWGILKDLNVTREEWVCLFSYVAGDIYACGLNEE